MYPAPRQPSARQINKRVSDGRPRSVPCGAFADPVRDPGRRCSAIEENHNSLLRVAPLDQGPTEVEIAETEVP